MYLRARAGETVSLPRLNTTYTFKVIRQTFPDFSLQSIVLKNAVKHTCTGHHARERNVKD